MTFRLLRRWTEPTISSITKQKYDQVHVEYETSVWEGALRAGDTGRRRTVRCLDVWFPSFERSDGTKTHPHFLNTAPSASYYRQLLQQAKVA